MKRHVEARFAESEAAVGIAMRAWLEEAAAGATNFYNVRRRVFLSPGSIVPSTLEISHARERLIRARVLARLSRGWYVLRDAAVD